LVTAERLGLKDPVRDSNVNILVVDDRQANLVSIEAMLDGMQVNLVKAHNGLEALRCLLHDDFALILMDVQMPDLDGLEATRQIRQREQGGARHVPIIAMTAHALKGDRERCLASGMDEYVSKPVRERQLLTALRTVLGEEVALPPDEAPAELLDRATDILNWEAALRVCGGDPELLRSIAEAFLEEHPRRLDEIRRAIDTADWELLHRSAHTIKGSMRYFEARAAFDRAFGLEQLAARQSLEGAEEIFDLLKQELAKLVPHLINYVQGRGGPAPANRG
jgi:CheY-like chemotaxis protein/HPt (histidine-containing phosphotransfer) domain-containing protein